MAGSMASRLARSRRNDMRPAAQRLDLGGKLGQPSFVACGQGHVGAGLGQRQGSGPPDAAAGAGDEGAAAVEAEAFEDWHGRVLAPLADSG